MKKYLALLLIFIMTLALISCGKTENGGNTDIIVPSDGEETIDLYDYEFVFKALTDYETFFYPTEYSSAYSDKILARYKETGNKFNCTVDVEAVTTTDTMISEITRANAVGDKYADLVDVTARAIYLNIDNFEPLNDIENFDVTSSKWGPPQYLETTLFKGKNYGFIAYYWGMPYPQYIGNLFFMKAVICDEFGLQNPQELYEAKKWDWETFREYSRSLTIVDNSEDGRNRYGFVVSGEMKMPRAFIISNGVQLIEKNQDTGRYESHINDPRVVAALDFLSGMVEEGIGFYTTDAWEVAARMFKDKETAFYEAYNKHAFVNAELHLASDLGEEYSWIPYPCGPSGTYGTSTAQFWYTCRFLAMPLSSDSGDFENNIIIINDLFEPLEGETETSWWDVVKENYFFDDLSFKYYIELFEGGHTDYSTVSYDAVFSNHVAVYSRTLNGTMSAVEAIAAQEANIQADIDENLNSVENLG